MTPNENTWEARFEQIRVVIRQRGQLFEVEVGDATLTHYHPENGHSLDEIKLRAWEHALRFAQLRPNAGAGTTVNFPDLQWKLSESEEQQSSADERDLGGFPEANFAPHRT